MNLSFSGRGLSFLAHFMATKDIRYYLKGVYVRPMTADEGGGVLAAATNGHILGMWRDHDGECGRPAILRILPGMVTACRHHRRRADAREGATP